MNDNKKIKILRIITWLPVGGIEKRILKVLPLLNEPPFEVGVCCIRERGELAEKLEEKGIKVETIPFKTRLDPIALWKLTNYIKKENIRILHTHMYRSNIPGTIAGKLAKVPVIISQIHNINTWETRRQVWMDKFLCKYRSGIIAVSEEVKSDIVNTLNVSSDFCKVIYNGVEIEKFSNLPKNKDIFKPFGIKDDDIVVIMVARLVEQKNPDLAVKSFRKVLDKNQKCHLIFAGSGKLEATLKNMALEMGISQYVHFLGMRDDIPNLLAASDIFLLPSSKEGFSNAILEALASGLPVIASDIGSNREVITDGVNGFLISIGDTNRAAEKINYLIENKEQRLNMGCNAMDSSKNFSIESMVKNLKEYYMGLLNK